MKMLRIIWAVLAMVLLSLENAWSLDLTPTGFYYPTGVSDVASNTEWLDSGCGHNNSGYFSGYYHIGHDIMGVIADPVYSISEGVVEYVSTNAEAWGSTNGAPNKGVLIRHRLSDGGYFLALYGHIQSDYTNSNIGLSVSPGSVIGTIGSWPYGIHLHFGVLPGVNYPSGNWGRMPCSDWSEGADPETNGFVDPINWITTHYPMASSQVGYFADGWHNDGSSQAFVDEYNLLAGQGHNLGDPWDNGGSVYVHELNGMLIQDFQGANNNFDLPYTAITYFHNDPWYPSDRIPRLLKQGFWWEYMNHKGWVNLGVPVTDEYPAGNNVRQRFWRLGPNYANNPSDWEERYLEWNPSLETIVPLDQNAQPMSWAEATIVSGGWMSGLEDFQVITEPSGHGDLNEELGSDFGGGGSGLTQVYSRSFGASFQISDQATADARDNRTANGVYHSGVQVADFDQPFELLDQQNYSGFYAMVNDAAIPIESFTMDGDMTIYIDSPPPAADLQFDFWTIYPNPGIVGGELHVEGEMWNAGGVTATATEVRVELLDPNGAEVYHYSEYGVTVDPGWSWYQWLYCYPYMPGNHTARFRCQVAGQWQTLAITTIYVHPVPPTANFSRTPIAGTVPLMVQFTDQSGNYPTAWNWNFGDGQVSTARHPSHNYNSVGVFNVSLTATNSAGSNSTTWNSCVTVNSPPSPPVANFTANVTSGVPPLSVQFTDLSTANPTSWNWNFGDGQTSNLQNPNHSYNSVGVYNVMLSVANVGGSNYLLRQGYVNVAMPSALLRLDITRLSNGGIALNWDTVPGAITYNVYSQRNGGEWELLFETPDPGCSMGGSGFGPGNFWLFYVTAVM